MITPHPPALGRIGRFLACAAVVAMLTACGGGSSTVEVQGPNASVLRFNGQEADVRQVRIALNSENLPALPNGVRVVSDFHQLSPDKTTLDGATLQLPLDPAAPQNVRLLALNTEGRWAEVPNTKRRGQVLHAELAHLSTVVAVVDSSASDEALTQTLGLGISHIASANASTGSPIVKSPESLSRAVGEAAVLSATIQWLEGDRLEWISTAASRPGAQSLRCDSSTRYSSYAVCRIVDVQAAQDGAQIFLRVTRNIAPFGPSAFDSKPATLTVTGSAVSPMLTLAPSAATVDAGQTANFSADASGTGPLSWQWLKDGVLITGANAQTLALPTTASEAGRSYRVAVRVSNAKGSVTSPEVLLNVTTPGKLIKANEGGTLPGPDGTEIVIPPGALSSDSRITVRSEPVPTGLLPAGVIALGSIVSIEPASVSFVKPVQLVYPLPALPDGHTLIFLPVEDTTNSTSVRALSSRSSGDSSTGVRPMAPRVDMGTACANVQNAVEGKLAGALSRAGKHMAAAIDVRSCSSVAPLANTGFPNPSITQCVSDDAFKPGAASLLNRHVDCQVAVAIGTTLQADIQRSVTAKPDASWSLLPSPKYDPTKFTVQSVDLYAGGLLETRVSLHGDSNVLSKTLTVSARLTGGVHHAESKKGLYPLAASAQARIYPTCTNADACGPLGTLTLNVPIGGGWSAPASMTIGFKTPAVGEQLNTRIDLSRVEYAVGSNSFSTPYTGTTDPGGRRVWSNNLDSSPELTCDNGRSRSKTMGCVFEEAAAVFDPQKTPASSAHIAEAMVRTGFGSFALAQDSRALPSSEALGRALSRTRNLTLIKANRATSKSLCDKRPWALPAPASCPAPIEDPDEIVYQGACDCDEYPFASTEQGASTIDINLASVKRIPSIDNRSAGGQLGTFYTQQRIKDGSRFWVKR